MEESELRQKRTLARDFLQFLQKEVQMREDAAAQGTPAASPAVHQSQPSQPRSARSATSVLRIQGRSGRAGWVCGVCQNGRHGLSACPTYRSMDVASRWRAVRQEGLCYQCLGPHMVRVCTSSACPRCGEAHHSSLHDAGGSAAPVRPSAASVRPPAAPVHMSAAPVRLPAAPARQGTARPSPAAPPRAVDRSMHAVTCAAPAAAAAWSPGWPDHLTFQDSQTPAWTGRAPVELPSGGEVTGHASAVGPSVQSPSAAAVQPSCQATSPREGKRLYNVNAQSSCFVQTVLVEVSGPGGVCQVRALIDGGSDSSFIRSSLAEKLGLETEEQGVFACVGFLESTEEARVYDRVSVKLTGRQGGEATLSFWKTDRLCVPVGTYSLPENLSLPPSVVLADDYREGSVDLLIGCDQIYQVVMWDQVEVGPGLRLIETVFGHVLHGQAQNQQTGQRRVYRCQLADVERMWSLDAVGISAKETADEVPPEPTWNPEEQRYQMGLLWKSDSRPASKLTSTELRTRRLVSKMSTDELDRYDRHISELIVNGVVEDAPLTDDPDDAFFLPHRGVVRGDKLRVVFDGSAPDATGGSLNEYLSPGENLLSRLPSVLLNFRTNAVGCQADIRAAFHQIVLKEEDRRYVQFLWGDRHLRFQRVPFGVSCWPYMLLRTVCCHVRQCLVSQPELMQKVQGALYMDDLCPTFGTREEAAAGMKEVSSVFSKARMELHKTRTTGDVSSEDSKVLGLAWNTETDRLAVTVPEMLCPRTRSELLSAVAKPFDPLGLLTPWLVRGKALFQRTWSVELTWDEPLPDALQAEVAAWWQDSAGSTVSFPRAAMIGETSLGTHVFCDASKTAYCATVYVSQGGESDCQVVRDNALDLVSHAPRSVKWSSIPEAAPWWGGFWERLVGVTKSALKITLHQCHLSYDELALTPYELAFHLNLRPLTPGDGDDLLTPAHLLFGVTTISGVVCPSLDSDSHVGRTWRNRRRVSDRLVRRWTTEYLETLRGWAASPRGRPTRLPAVGEVVLLQGEGRRGTWPLARVVSLIPGPDGRCRAAFLRVRGKLTRRPISRLFSLEAAE
ncbi:uncharacterized protein LOC122368221 isoform X2 [Amphibalanus amphitrite]|uniref:uncharacterized protein LOC122368221 isoform X2 n=1 Tax=Amphibalanus amphitrite TaxID=1232801 RepID=UPI001C915664|nr:uncharacterized protein LOC122368221 isoform X2 [Amphibalanus amphitrite]